MRMNAETTFVFLRQKQTIEIIASDDNSTQINTFVLQLNCLCE